MILYPMTFIHTYSSFDTDAKYFTDYVNTDNFKHVSMVLQEWNSLMSRLDHRHQIKERTILTKVLWTKIGQTYNQHSHIDM